MKKILSILLIAVLLTACGKSDPVEETIVKLPDGSYIVTGVENAPGNDESISLKSTDVIWIYSLDADGNVVPAYIELNKEQQEKLQEALALINTFTYPKLAAKEDGSYEVIQVDKNGDPVDIPKEFNIFELLGDVEIRRMDYSTKAPVTYPALRLMDDGSYAVVIMSEDGTPVERTKVATKVSRFYSAEGKLQWTMAVTATFTYNGLEAKCSNISTKVTIAEPDNWYLISEDTNGTRYSVCFGRTTLGVTTSTPTFEILLNCNRQGNLS